jgi:hypothetical protein
MRGLLYVLALCLVAVVAVWAYRVNYRTLAALDRVEGLRAEIAAEHEAIGILSVEWAYLNAPARLSRLAERHLPELGLVPLSPDHFAEVAMVAYPAPPPLVANAAPIEQADLRAEAAAALEAALAAALAVQAAAQAELPEDPARFAETAEVGAIDDVAIQEGDVDAAAPGEVSFASASAVMRLPAPRPSQGGGAR